MTVQNQELRSVDPDLLDVPLYELAELGDSVLAHSLALYRQRLDENGVLLSAFESVI
jgi:FXSXX-COOH protein